MKRYIALQKVVSLGSFTKAAKSLGCTQSSISQMISSLEDELSTKILVRSRNGISLTPEGKELYPYIEKYIRQYDNIRERADEIKGLERGVIRIGTIASVSSHWLPEFIRDFERMYPGVDFLLNQGVYDMIEEWIKNGEVDFGFVAPSAVTNLQTVDLKDGEMVAIVPSDHPLASKKKVKLEELTKDPFILLETGVYSEPMEAFEAKGLTPNLKYTIHDDYTIMMMVEKGLAISIVSKLVLTRSKYDIVQIPLDPPLYRTISIAYKDKDMMPVASRMFIDYMVDNKDRLS